MKFARRRSKRAIAGIIATVIMFAILFTVGTSYFIFVSSENSAYVQSLLSATNKLQGGLAEGLSITTLLGSNGTVEFYANDTSSQTANMTAVLVISSTGALISCQGVGFPAGAGCTNTTPALWLTVNAGDGSPTIDTGYTYVAGTTLTLKVLTANGNSYSAAYPEPASQSASSQSVTVNLDNLKWVQLIPQASTLVQKAFVANCNAANCAATFGSNLASGNILVAALSWFNHSPPSTPTDTRGDLFTLGASNSVVVPSSPVVVQHKYVANCNAVSCGLAYTSNVVLGNTLAYSLGWFNQNPPSAPTDTRGDTFILGASQTAVINPPSPAVVQQKFASNCNSSSCALAYGSSVTSGNTLVYGLGWSANAVAQYVPITVTNSVGSGLSVDTSLTNDCSGATSCSISVTTTKPNELIYVSFSNSVGGNSLTSFSDAAGLSWHQRAYAGSGTLDQYTYYAVAPSILSSDNISVQTSANGNLRFFVLAIIGANLVSPFDPHAGIPAIVYNGASTSASVSFTTSNANDLILAAEKTANTAPATGAAGYTFLNCCSNTGYYANFEYKIVAATGTYTPTFAWGGASDSWGEIGDAIQAAPTTSTPAIFQEMVTWNPSTYQAYEANDLGNVRFCADNACATILNSWLESCTPSCTPTATSASAWVKLTSAIAGNGGTTTIYMTFGPTNLEFDSNTWGEAPTLSGTYGQYDNGAIVFPTLYQNFAGVSTPAGWTSSGSAYAVNNGLTSASSAGAGTGGAFYTTSTFGLSATQILDVFGEWATTACTTVDNNVDFGYVTSASPGKSVVGWSVDGANTCADAIISSTGTETFGVNSIPNSAIHVYSTYWSATGSSTNSIDYNTLDPITATTPASAVNVGFSIFNTAGKYHSSGPFNWLRVRAFPPNGAMPSTTFGGLTAGHPLPSTPTDTLGSTFTLGASQSVTNGGIAYYSYIWYATAASTGADTITATFTYTVAGSVSIYELIGYSTAGVLSSSGSSVGGSTSASVGSFTPSSNSFVTGNVETALGTTKYTLGAGYTTVQSGATGCDANDASRGCSEYQTGLGLATTAPFTLSASAVWVEAAMSLGPTPITTYYSYIWYATAASSGADTITAAFGSTVTGSVSIYEISGVTATGLLTSTGSSSSSQGASSVTSISPGAGSVVVGNTETSSTTFTAGAGYTLSGVCNAVYGCGEYQTGVGSATTVPMSLSPSAQWAEVALAFAPIMTTYYSYIWYATVGTAGADTVTAAFGTTVTASVSIYEINGFTTSGALSSTGSSVAGSTTASVAPFTPATDSFIIGNTESASASTTYTATAGFTRVGACTPAYGCSEYNVGGGGSASTVPITLSASAPWVEAAMSFSTPFNPQSGIQVNGYPTMGVPSGASLVWEVTFTNVDPQHRAITIWPQTEMAIGSAEYDGFDTDYTQAHYYLIDSLNPGSTTVNAYTKTTGQFFSLAYNVPTTLFFAATAALGSTTQAFGTNVLTPFEAYFALTGVFNDGTLFGETIPYPYGIITQSNAYTTPTAGATAATATVSCTSPCHFTGSAKAMVGWINAAGQLTQLTTFTTTAGGNVPAGVTFQVPTAVAGYYTIEVTDYINSVFMTFQHT